MRVPRSADFAIAIRLCRAVGQLRSFPLSVRVSRVNYRILRQIDARVIRPDLGIADSSNRGGFLYNRAIRRRQTSSREARVDHCERVMRKPDDRVIFQLVDVRITRTGSIRIEQAARIADSGSDLYLDPARRQVPFQ